MSFFLAIGLSCFRSFLDAFGIDRFIEFDSTIV